MNKIEERRIFDTVFKNKYSDKVINSESPDFLCTHNGKPFLGVEVTDLFVNESAARLSKISHYALDLIDGEDYRHKDNKTTIKVDSVMYKSKDNAIQQFKGVIMYLPPMKKRFDMLSDILNSKSININKYFKKAPAIDLIVVDRSGLFLLKDKEKAAQIIQNSQIRSSIITGGFRETFLLLKSEGDKSFILPARLNIFVEEIFKFERAIKELLKEKKISITKKVFVQLLVCYLMNIGFNECRGYISKTKMKINSSAACMVFSKKRREIFNYMPLPEMIDHPKEQMVEVDNAKKNKLMESILSKTIKMVCSVNLINESDIRF